MVGSEDRGEAVHVCVAPRERQPLVRELLRPRSAAAANPLSLRGISHTGSALLEPLKVANESPTITKSLRSCCCDREHSDLGIL